MDSSSKAHRGFIIPLTGNFLPGEYIRGFRKPPLSGFTPGSEERARQWRRVVALCLCEPHAPESLVRFFIIP